MENNLEQFPKVGHYYVTKYKN